ncbi:MAG: FAD:protein FMN transferase [Clostridiales bacterium]|uniref:FAD:protein FMN transferase n=1 Tax=Intestinimonas massiliensis (ex Afouda et al. 2020) TaxID=1673721 RepID=A0ABS9M6U5_9FIRM|nr:MULTISPECIES: FAD:protein FMN transferase [Intestinimonas]MBS6282034.1 FAD:protein FMN transferase [Oscillospiraceae bacterium]MDU1324564.1 FAD:protein FMN transferase [Clostridiales bacterium]MCG4526519.1 FAD:protein FMN transferase [Intestinimonas massiliensis (ex Afouda et al. 2020)]MCI5562756.1 FAD:protein FMN transferase [Intestinimonas massiliensis (ex Afouda et al. 2020)]MCQ4806199.1 FAD:protein FMN transferase [Intestinimonas massiliensis (ex Afouda et al. 2020)]
MRRLLAALCAALLLALTACTPRSQTPERHELTYLDVFDTVTTLVAYGGTGEDFSAEAGRIHAELLDYHRLYDIYNDYPGLNNLKTVNDRAGEAPVEVDRRIIDLLLEAREMYGVTGGKVNVAFGSVLSIWHDYREAGILDPERAALPPMEALRAAAEHTDPEAVVIDEERSTVYLADPAMSLDVGAIAKGYAAQRVCDSARARGVESLLLSVGGNVCAIGSRLGADDPWPVGVENPFPGEGGYLHTLRIAGQNLVTSGSYQRYYTVDGRDYHHIIDPDTLMPADYFVSVTVLADDSGKADALSTALFNLPYEAGKELAESLDGVEAFWVEPDGTEHCTDGFQAVMDDQT